MKKFTVFFVFALMNISLIYSQYSGPESVTYDSAYNRWLVTNNNGIIKQRSASGVVTDFAPSGSGTHGIRIYNGVAYVCASNRIKGFSLASGTEVFNVQLTGATFLNGMGISGTGIAYISDFTAQKIYKLNLNTQAWWIYVQSPGGQPNGVYVDSPRNRLLVCYWGTNAAIRSVNLADSSVTLLASTGYNNCDGIYLDRYDNVYVSAWSPAPSKILRYDINFTLPVAIVINSGIGNPADIFINKNADTLGVPNASLNTVTFHNIGNIAGVQQINSGLPGEFRLHQNYPNPFNPTTKIRFDIPTADNVKLAVYNSLGQQVSVLLNEALSAGTYEIGFNAMELPSGIYIYTLKYGNRSASQKMILIK